ncbi:Hypothetical protein HVR_LOCUS413 [uncultured virus]|nr:Hypothetical protein HVR_LOCUS413 [uncultured virus]
MSYSLTNQTSIIFGTPDENTRSSDEHIVKQGDIDTWRRFRLAFWFIGKSSRCIYAKYPMETVWIKLTHKVVDGKFHIYYHPKYESDIIITYIGKDIKVGLDLKLSDSGPFPDSDCAHVFL